MSLREAVVETSPPQMDPTELRGDTSADITQGTRAVRPPSDRPDTSAILERDKITEGIDRVVRLLPQRRAVDSKNRFVAHKEWEGRVISVDEGAGNFIAGLIDLASGETQEFEQGEFALSNVQDYDRNLVRPGAIFRWVVGTRYIGRTKERSSRVVFRRLPAWSERDLAKLEQDAKTLESALRQR